ncbi:hypothetical protein A2U01_0060264, partial [Trifolium medium]|nr:hypothetical protein [Trifolium medium]
MMGAWASTGNGRKIGAGWTQALAHEIGAGWAQALTKEM